MEVQIKAPTTRVVPLVALLLVGSGLLCVVVGLAHTRYDWEAVGISSAALVLLECWLVLASHQVLQGVCSICVIIIDEGIANLKGLRAVHVPLLGCR